MAMLLENSVEIEDPIEEGKPNKETLDSFNDIEEKRNLLGPYASVEEMFQDFGIR